MIPLVKAADCKHNRQKQLAIKIEEQLKPIDKPISIPLVKIEDCSSIKKRWAEKITNRQLGQKIRSKDIDIPKGDKRYSCEHYDKENRSCSVYPKRYCSRCKKNILPKPNGYGWTHNYR
jgi:hypothetical protein